LLRSPLLHFLILGALLFALRGVFNSPDEAVVIEVPRSEIDERIQLFERQMGRAVAVREAQAIENQVVEDTLWLKQARVLGLHKIDSVVRQRLILNMRFLEGEDSQSSDDELYARAIELGMDESDTVVQRRLIDRVQAILRAAVRANPPDEAALRAHYAARAERWREPALLDLSHVYFSRDRRGEATRSDASTLLEELRSRSVEPDAAVELGDPFLAGHRLRAATPNQIISRLGPEFAAGVEGAEIGRWIGPIDSAFGSHLVWIHGRDASQIPAFDTLRLRVLEDWIDVASDTALREQIVRVRERVVIRIVEDGTSNAAKLDTPAS
jgi:hypothetical protein